VTLLTADTELAECKRSLRDAKMHEAAAKETAATLKATVETSSGLISRYVHHVDFNSNLYFASRLLISRTKYRAIDPNLCE
jgi:hypothetical protein